METRTSKKTGEKISLLGFGCMRLPLTSENTQDIDTKLADEMVDLAMANGVNYFDTAYVYHGKESESFIGNALARYPREKFNLATKLTTKALVTDDDVDRIFNEQLAKCKVEYFDYYLIHNVSRPRLDAVQKFRLIERLHEKKRQGLIRNLGFSYHDNTSFLPEFVGMYDWDFAQIQLNYLDWETQDAAGLYTILTDAGIPVIVMEPVRGGALATLSESAIRILKDANPAVSPASWAMRFAASLPNVLTVLSGMSTMEQVQDNIATMRSFTPLSEAEHETIAKALVAYRQSGAIPCTACGYCMDCPSGVDIPRSFAAYNTYRATRNDMTFQLHLAVLGEARQPKHCTSCGLCLPQCPQQLDIPGLMQEITKAAESLA
ncbi:aldo/keto reductase [Desulfovibrio sp. OttesenSCG-928-I05]|nr:aldo/keto reductase [Desulfovibrio sp. OttesenSCG-928-I05]